MHNYLILEKNMLVPNRAEEAMVEPQLEAGGCFMTTGKAEGKLRPWSLSLMSFIAMENSTLSIFPSLSMSAKFLKEGKKKIWSM